MQYIYIYIYIYITYVLASFFSELYKRSSDVSLFFSLLKASDRFSMVLGAHEPRKSFQ